VLGYIELILTKQLADALEWLRNSINNVAVLKVFFEACFPVTSDGGAGDPQICPNIAYGKCLHICTMLLHSVSDMDQRRLNMRHSEQSSSLGEYEQCSLNFLL